MKQTELYIEFPCKASVFIFNGRISKVRADFSNRNTPKGTNIMLQ